jgi:predicted RNA-binding protein YlxR (DUF448 family)/ribosomal protein L30E
MAAQADIDDHREANAASRHTRSRRCIVTGEVLPEGRLLRFVGGPDSQIVVDVAARLPGRGLWVRSDRESVAHAVKKRLFSRAAKAPLKAADDLADTSEERLAAHMLQLLGLALKSGELLLGFDSVEKALRSGKPPAVVIEASDGAQDGMRKLQGAALASDCVPFVIGCFSSAELSLALGRANVIHAALKSGRMAERLIFDAGRIAGFRPLKPWFWAGFSPEGALAGRKRDASGLVRTEGLE